MISIETHKLTKRFGRRLVFKNINLFLNDGKSLAVTGRNGSGKTTLLSTLAGLTAPSSGKIEIKVDDESINPSKRRHHLSYVGPELTLYDSLTAWENIQFFATLQGKIGDRSYLMSLFETVGLADRRNDFYGSYSSGMKQRLKYAVALINNPDILLLDEPTANLDSAGKDIVMQIISRQKNNGILIMATNERGEYAFAEERLELGD